jgi:hypothetical protein
VHGVAVVVDVRLALMLLGRIGMRLVLVGKRGVVVGVGVGGQLVLEVAAVPQVRFQATPWARLAAGAPRRRGPITVGGCASHTGQNWRFSRPGARNRRTLRRRRHDA